MAQDSNAAAVPTFSIGDKVRVKQSVLEPVHGWGNMTGTENLGRYDAVAEIVRIIPGVEVRSGVTSYDIRYPDWTTTYGTMTGAEIERADDPHSSYVPSFSVGDEVNANRYGYVLHGFIERIDKAEGS